MPGLLSIPEVARELDVSRWTVWQLVKAGRLRAERVGRDWVITRADLNRFKRSYQRRRRSPPSP